MMLLSKFLKHPQIIKGGAARWDWADREYYRDDTLRHRVLPLVPKARVIAIQMPEGFEHSPAWEPGDKPMSPPFPLCWIELFQLKGNLPVMMIGEDGVRGKLPVEVHGSHTMGLPPAPALKAMGPVGMLIHETKPGVCDFWIMEVACNIDKAALPGQNGEAHLHSLSVAHYPDVDAYSDVSKWPPPLALAHGWLRMLNEGAMTVEHTEMTVLVPRADRVHKRKPHVIRQIVRVMPKALWHKAEPITQGGIVDWSHRWEVRGHWRRVKGLGKDRAGEYVVVGHTWVKEFVKGPQDKPLVVKTRVLTDPLTSAQNAPILPTTTDLKKTWVT